MDKISFIAVLYVYGLSCFGIGGGSVYEWCQFRVDGRSGLMESSDPRIARSLKYGEKTGLIRADVTYVTIDGSVLVAGKYLAINVAERLSLGEKIPIRFLASNPYNTLVDGKQVKIDWGWLVFGFLVLMVAIYAHRLLRKEIFKNEHVVCK